MPVAPQQLMSTKEAVIMMLPTVILSKKFVAEIQLRESLSDLQKGELLFCLVNIRPSHFSCCITVRIYVQDRVPNW